MSRVAFEHAVGELEQDGRGVTITISTPEGTAQSSRGLCRRLRRGNERRPRAARRQDCGLDLRGALARRRRDRQKPQRQRNHLHLRPAPPDRRTARGRRSGPLGIHAAARRERRTAEERRQRSGARQAAESGIDAFEVERKAVYTFHARVADRWRVGRVFLAGDAAHLMPPFAGQGMNGGMKDAVNLAWKLVAVVRGQASEDILDTYDVERAPVVRKMVEVSRRLGSLIMPTSRIVGVARDCLFACLNTSSRFRAFIARGGFLPPPAIHRSVLTASGRDALIGQMAPQPKIRTAQGESQLDQFLACHQWVALGFEADPALMLSRRDHGILAALDARFISLNSVGPAKSPQTLALQCHDSGFIDWAKKHGVRGVLVRPDRFIAARLDAGSRPRGAEPIRHGIDRGSLARRLTIDISRRNPCCIPHRQAGPGSVELPRSLAPIVKANSLLYVHFERPDLEKAERYLSDFGLLVTSRSEDRVFFRGTSSRPFIYRVTRGPKPRFVGLGLSAPSAGISTRLPKRAGPLLNRSRDPAADPL